MTHIPRFYGQNLVKNGEGVKYIIPKERLDPDVDEAIWRLSATRSQIGLSWLWSVNIVTLSPEWLFIDQAGQRGTPLFVKRDIGDVDWCSTYGCHLREAVAVVLAGPPARGDALALKVYGRSASFVVYMPFDYVGGVLDAVAEVDAKATAEAAAQAAQ